MTATPRGKDEIQDVINWLTGWSPWLPLEQQPGQELWSAQIKRLRSAVAAREHAFAEKDEVGHQRLGELERENAALKEQVTGQATGAPDELVWMQRHEVAELIERAKAARHVARCLCEIVRVPKDHHRADILGETFTAYKDPRCVALRERAEAAEATVELLKGELKAVEDGTGLTNVVQQLESQIEAERSAREAAERRLREAHAARCECHMHTGSCETGRDVTYSDHVDPRCAALRAGGTKP